MRKGFSLVGSEVGRLTVVAEASRRFTPSGISLRFWICRCSCGNSVERSTGQLSGAKLKHPPSCGCLKREKTVARNFVHGFAARNSKPPEYLVWKAMRERCSGARAKDRKHYADRGISVCQRWESFAAFYEDMGPRPGSGYSIDRIDNEQGYYPENCRWADARTQRHNQRRYIADHPEVATHG